MASSEPRRLPLLLHDDPDIDSVTVALNYRCQSRCRFCFIEPELDMDLPDTDRALLDRVCDENVRRGVLYRRIIFSGAECTLRRDLADIAHYVKKRGRFEIVQIQTNGRKLADRHYLIQLLAAGIDEYFVSVHGGTAEQDAYLTRSPKSFEQMRQGLRNLRELEVTFMSNSVVTESSYRKLPELADFLVAEQVPHCHFWAFIEYGDIAQTGEHVRFTDAAPYLREAVAKLRAAGRRISLSWFPECLLGEHAQVVDNHRATLLIHDEFSTRAAAHSGFSCPHQTLCPRFGRSCVGLHERYVAVFGDHADVLTPLPPSSGA